MGNFTRRTHIVRVPMDDPPVKEGDTPTEYMDYEVLDAIAFRVARNEEVVLSMDTATAAPYIVDKTGGGHGKTPGSPTRRSHMERIGDAGGPQVDVEVIDCWSARDQRGEEWVLDMGVGSKNPFDITDGSGDSRSTRRAHDEVITVPFGKSKKDAGDDYVTCQRSDNIAFRKVHGEEVIISCPSCDDTISAKTDFGRTSTFMTPPDYDPSDDSDNAVAPPLLSASKDQHNYAFPVKDATSFLTKDTKLQMGPFWWIRKVQSAPLSIIIEAFWGSRVQAGHPEPIITILGADKDALKSLKTFTSDGPGAIFGGQSITGGALKGWDNDKTIVKVTIPSNGSPTSSVWTRTLGPFQFYPSVGEQFDEQVLVARLTGLLSIGSLIGSFIYTHPEGTDHLDITSGVQYHMGQSLTDPPGADGFDGPLAGSWGLIGSSSGAIPVIRIALVTGKIKPGTVSFMPGTVFVPAHPSADEKKGPFFDATPHLKSTFTANPSTLTLDFSDNPKIVKAINDLKAKYNGGP